MLDPQEGGAKKAIYLSGLLFIALLFPGWSLADDTESLISELYEKYEIDSTNQSRLYGRQIVSLMEAEAERYGNESEYCIKATEEFLLMDSILKLFLITSNKNFRSKEDLKLFAQMNLDELLIKLRANPETPDSLGYIKDKTDEQKEIEDLAFGITFKNHGLLMPDETRDVMLALCWHAIGIEQ